LGTRFQQDFNAAAQEHGVPAQCVGLPTLLALKWTPADAAINKPLFTLYLQEMTRRGVFMGGGVNVCEAITDADLDRVQEAHAQVFPILAQALERGEVQARLDGAVSSDIFRRLVG
jgi:glutamate-1-semialdehyde aminotransferase